MREADRRRNETHSTRLLSSLLLLVSFRRLCCTVRHSSPHVVGSVRYGVAPSVALPSPRALGPAYGVNEESDVGRSLSSRYARSLSRPEGG